MQLVELHFLYKSSVIFRTVRKHDLHSSDIQGQFPHYSGDTKALYVARALRFPKADQSELKETCHLECYFPGI